MYTFWEQINASEDTKSFELESFIGAWNVVRNER